MLYRLGLHITARFERTISGAVDRLEEIGPAKFKPIGAGQKAEAAQEIEASSPPQLPPGDTSLFGRFQSSVQTWISTIPAEQRQSELIRLLVSWQIGWTFEVVNFFVTWEARSLSCRLSTPKPLTLSAVRTFYDRGAAQEPEFYATYVFENWLAWLRDTAHAASASDDGLVAITEEGREFLKYLIARGYPLTRFG